MVVVVCGCVKGVLQLTITQAVHSGLQHAAGCGCDDVSLPPKKLGMQQLGSYGTVKYTARVLLGMEAAT